MKEQPTLYILVDSGGETIVPFYQKKDAEDWNKKYHNGMARIVVRKCN